MKHSILFTGHMIDAPGRKKARFPAEKESKVMQAINDCLMQQTNRYGACMGIAGAACGGDIIFHERCQSAGIPSEIILAEPVDSFKKNSVTFAGGDWEKRFDRLINGLQVVTLLPTVNSGLNIWENANNYMLSKALEHGSEHASLIALWDGEGGDGPGGTRHLVHAARAQKLRVQIIDITAL